MLWSVIYPASAVEVMEKPQKEFVDVKSDDWYYDAVHFMEEKGLMQGMDEDTFSPQSSTSRAMLVTILWRMEKSPAQDAEVSFPDVAEGSYYESAVGWASTNHLVSGYDNGCFGPDDPITREQLAAILYRYMDSPEIDSSKLDDFLDAGQISAYASDAMCWAVSEGIISGVESNLLAPQSEATRAQVAAMLMRLVKLQESIDDGKDDGSHSSGSSGGGSSGGSDPDQGDNQLEGIEGSDADNYSITAVERAGDAFTVTYSGAAACELVVRLYSEDGKIEYMSMKMPVSASVPQDDGSMTMSTATVTAAKIVPPTFLLVAVLQDENGKALSNSYTTLQYTSAYKEYEDQTVESLEAAGERVIDYGDAGLAVVADDVKMVEDLSVENADGSYTLPAGNAVSAGDELMLLVDRTPGIPDDPHASIPVKVLTATQNADNTVTVTLDNSANLSDFYDVIKIDVFLSGGEVEQTGDTFMLRAAQGTDKETVITPFKINTGFTIQDHLQVDVNGSFKLKVKLLYDKERFGEDYFEAELTQTLSTNITGTVTGSVGTSTMTDPAKLLDVEVPIGTTPLMADVEVTFPVTADITAEGSFQVKLEVGAGYRYTTVDGAQKTRNTANNGIEAKIAGKFEIGAGPKLAVGVEVPGEFLSAGVSGQSMLSLHGDTDQSVSVDPESKHACDLCVDGAVDLNAKIKGSVNYKLCEWAEGSLVEITLADTTIDLCTFYYSAINGEDSMFKGQPHFEVNADCPNKSYPITILTKHLDGQDAEAQIEITYGNDHKPKATISSGETIWLCSGANYHLKATIDGNPVVKTIMVTGKEIVTLFGQGVSLSGAVTEKNSGSPVALAQVTLTNGTKTLTDTTATDGQYLVEGIPTGTYTLQIQKDGYKTYTTELTLTADAVHNAVLEISGSRITGTVTGPDGSVLSGVLVTISRDGVSKQCTTGSDGTYQSDPLEAGEYTVVFSKFGYNSVNKTVTVYDGDADCDAVMEKASANLTVTVTDEESQPIQGAQVSLYEDAEAADPVAWGTTDETGVTVWDELTAGTYTIKVAKDGFAPYSGTVQVNADEENQKNVMLQVGGSCGPTLYWKAEGTKLIIYGEGPMYNYGKSSTTDLNKTGNAPWRSISGLNEVEIQQGATTIGDAAFRNMTSLEKATLSEGITYIGEYAFQNTSLGDTVFPTTLTSMGRYAFSMVDTMRNLDLSLTQLAAIPYRCFGDAGLNSIQLPTTLREIADYAFYGSNGSSGQTMEIPNGVEKIGEYAFAKCYFGSYTLPDTVRELGESVFMSNEYLKEIRLPNSIEKMGSGVLAGCTQLVDVVLPENPNLTELEQTLQGCTALQQVTVPDTVEVLTKTFSSCSALREVTLSQSLKTVGEETFFGCRWLTSVELPETLTTIGKKAFWMSAIRTLTIPADILNIEDSGLYKNSDGWDTIYFDGTKERWDELMLAGGDDGITYTLICEGQSYEYPENQGA
ncbi:MAG: leucine-rich repeat protein [Eubacteriales bacterium]